MLRKWGSLISVSLEMHVIYFALSSIAVAHIDKSNSNVLFLWGIYSGFSYLKL